MNFVAIDWETANAFRGSPCAVGVVTVEHGEVVEAWGRLMRPPGKFGHFDAANTAVHGLCERDVAAQPAFEELWPEVRERLERAPVVAHNATFDLGVIQGATWCSHLRCPSLTYGCTLVLSRQHYDLPSYTLDAVSAAAGVDLAQHHEALADATAAAEVVLAIARDLGTTTLVETFGAYGIELGQVGGPDARPCRVERRTSGCAQPAAEEQDTLW